MSRPTVQEPAAAMVLGQHAEGHVHRHFRQVTERRLGQRPSIAQAPLPRKHVDAVQLERPRSIGGPRRGLVAYGRARRRLVLWSPPTFRHLDCPGEQHSGPKLDRRSQALIPAPSGATHYPAGQSSRAFVGGLGCNPTTWDRRDRFATGRSVRSAGEVVRSG